MIESILGYKSVWRILSLLFETPKKPISRKELFNHTKLGNAPLSNGLNRLVKSELIIKNKKGKKEFYYINENNEYVNLIKQLWEIEREKLRNLDYDIKIILSEFSRNVDCESVYLFGSWAKGNATINSDIDLAVVGGNELLITKIVSEIEKKFSKKLQIHNYSGNIKKEVDNYGIRIV